MLVSIAIPVYEMKGQGVYYLHHNLQRILNQQTNFDIEIIISDQSSDLEIENYLKNFSTKPIKYFKDINRGNHSANTNNAIRNCNGEFIKILYQDDYFLDSHALQKTIDFFIKNHDKVWLISACEHSTDGFNLIRPFFPHWNENMIFGNNTYSSPSVLTIKKEVKNIFFDENIYFMPDVEYYYRMKNKYGEPAYLNEITVVNMIHANQTQKLINDKMVSDLNYIKEKYKL